MPLTSPKLTDTGTTVRKIVVQYQPKVPFVTLDHFEQNRSALDLMRPTMDLNTFDQRG
jgi:hypothetical protein